jgi:23S rRNA (pseudouridine1915-N3)-methyltransferase
VRLSVIAVGRIKDKGLRAVADDYLGRIQHYVRCDEVEARDAAGLTRAVPKETLIVALEVHGEVYSSEAFAHRLQRWSSQGKGSVAFLVGGADGIPPALSRSADVRLSLSPMTLPHRLARVVLLEQIYRALTILRGEPYAREP